MQIKYFQVEKLFGQHDYKINFFQEEKVTILHAVNGRGKTTILNLIDAIVNFNINTTLQDSSSIR